VLMRLTRLSLHHSKVSLKHQATYIHYLLESNRLNPSTTLHLHVIVAPDTLLNARLPPTAYCLVPRTEDSTYYFFVGLLDEFWAALRSDIVGGIWQLGFGSLLENILHTHMFKNFKWMES